MATKPKQEATQPVFSSLKDFAAKQAGHVLNGTAYAHWAADNIEGFPDDVSKESMEQIHEGYMLKYVEFVSPMKFLREGDAFIPLKADSAAPEGKEVIEIGPVLAMSYTSQAYGALRKDQPNFHSLIKSVRSAFQKYTSNAWNSLVATHRRMTAAPRERSVNKEFITYLDETFSGMTTRNKTALSRGDTTAIGTERLKHAIAEFRKAMNSGS